MCTAITYLTKDFYFGRNLDYMESYGEEVVVTPRNFPLRFRNVEDQETHYAMIGVACVRNDTPLYYDAVNEAGLGIAGLNFVGNAVYENPKEGAVNVASFELIPWILGQCKSLKQACKLLSEIHLTKEAFDQNIPPAQLHWIIADRYGAVTVEAMEDGIHLYKNPVGVLTNNPPFPIQISGLNQYMQLSAKDPENHFSPNLSPTVESRGMGALGLPGDLSSRSRFVRATFLKENSVSESSEMESVGQFFHILGAVEFPRGCCDLGGDQYDITIYSSCCNADRGIYYYTTYGNRQITAVDMYQEDLEGSQLVQKSMELKQQIRYQ